MRSIQVTGRRRERADRGAAMVEMAIILPILIMLVFGIIQFAIAFNRTQGLHAAAREGARTASISTASVGDINARVNDALTGINYDTAPSVSVSPTICNGRQGDQVTVTVTAPYTIAIPLLPSQTVTLTGQGVFRCE